MPVMGRILQQKLARSIEAKLRYELSIGDHLAGWGQGTIAFLARWIYDQRSPESPYTYLQYYNLARSTVRNARDAATMMANPEMTILDLQQSPGQPLQAPRHEYRVVVVGKDGTGEEAFSTLVFIYSDQPLNANQIAGEALHQYASQVSYPGLPMSPPITPQQAISLHTYLVSAGMRP